MRIFGGILPFVGYATRFITKHGECVATKADAAEMAQTEDYLVLVDVFEVSWFDRYVWFWVDSGGFLITNYAEKKVGE